MNDDFSELENMIYSGRGITVGMTPDGKPFIGYTLTGRSPSSQARKLVYNNTLNSIMIKVTDEKQLSTGNVSLLVYSAIEFIDDVRNKIIASNGKQTNILRQIAYTDDSLNAMQLLVKAHESKVWENKINLTTYEPDAPNFTPRISGCIDTKLGAFYIVRKRSDNDKEDPEIFTFELVPGQGKTVTTYHGGNENPLLPFKYRAPLLSEISSDNAQDICKSLYLAIGPKGNGDNYNNFRVAAAVMLLRGKKDLDVAVINKFDLGQ